MHYDVDQCGPAATGPAPDLELLAVSQPKLHELPVEKRKLENVREFARALVADQS